MVRALPPHSDAGRYNLPVDADGSSPMEPRWTVMYSGVEDISVAALFADAGNGLASGLFFSPSWSNNK